jgi:hypothetical protein
MSEPRDAPEQRKEGGLSSPPPVKPSDGGPDKARHPRDAEDIERDDSPGGREGGMIGEG